MNLSYIDYPEVLRDILDFMDVQPSEYELCGLTQGSTPYQTVYDKEGGKSIIVLNAMGVSKDDIKVEATREHGVDYLTISGETQNDLLDESYSVSGIFPLDSESVKGIEWETKDGLLLVEISIKEPEKSKIPVKAK